MGHVASLPRRAVPAAGPGGHGLVGEQGPGAGAHPGWLGSGGFPGSPAAGSPWGQGAAALPGCRLHLAALGDEPPAGEGHLVRVPPPSSGELRFNPSSPSALLRPREAPGVYLGCFTEGCLASCGTGNQRTKMFVCWFFVFFFQNKSFHKARGRWGRRPRGHGDCRPRCVPWPGGLLAGRRAPPAPGHRASAGRARLAPG